MARARSLKPGFFKNEQLAELSFEARLLFAGIWTIADREGRLENRPKRIKAEVFPYDKVNVERLLSDLVRSDFIREYESAGEKFLYVPTWKKHQSPHVKEQASTIPAPDKPGASPVQVTAFSGTSPSSSLTPCNGLPEPRAGQLCIGPIEPTEDEPSYWANRMYERHPKKKNLPLVLQWCAGRDIEFLREVDRVHALWCETEDWQKNNGWYAPKLDEWLVDRGWSKKPKSQVANSPYTLADGGGE